MQEIANELLDQVEEKGEMDLVKDYVIHFAIRRHF